MAWNDNTVFLGLFKNNAVLFDIAELLCNNTKVLSNVTFIEKALVPVTGKTLKINFYDLHKICYLTV